MLPFRNAGRGSLAINLLIFEKTVLIFCFPRVFKNLKICSELHSTKWQNESLFSNHHSRKAVRFEKKKTDKFSCLPYHT